MYEPYYWLANFNYAQWLRDYTKYSVEKVKARSECLIELFDFTKVSTYVALADYRKVIIKVIKEGSKHLPFVGLGAHIIDYNRCMVKKGF